MANQFLSYLFPKIQYLWLKSSSYLLINTDINLEDRQTMYRQFRRIWTIQIAQKSKEQFSKQDSKFSCTWSTCRFQEILICMTKQKMILLQKEQYLLTFKFYILVKTTLYSTFTFSTPFTKSRALVNFTF